MTDRELSQAWFDWARDPGRYDYSPYAFALEMVRRAKDEDIEIAAKYMDTGELIDEIRKAKP